MAYSITEAKNLVIQAGKTLVESGLIARTWGNISARISDTQFVITPSGLAYETLTPEQIVLINIADCSYQGEVKPSSEKGIHADTYRLRPEVNFVIHTHQVMASVISIEGKNLFVTKSEYKKVLGEIVPCAGYGMPSTNKLRKEVAAAIKVHSFSKAILMKYHGTLCMGNDMEHSFEIAQTLEQLATEKYLSICQNTEVNTPYTSDYGNSVRIGNSFRLKWDKYTCDYEIGNLPYAAPNAAYLHELIYKSSKVNSIIHTTEEEIIKVSRYGKDLKPYLDDLAQIAGVYIKTVDSDIRKPDNFVNNLRNKNAVLIENGGALCTGETVEDAVAVSMVLKKGCIADIYCRNLNLKKCLGTLDAYIQRIIYVTKYSKKRKSVNDKDSKLLQINK
ncbi:MAG: class II aldolase/adducin family protein [Lachnotalea sp.]